MTPREKKDSAIAAGVTALAALLIFLALYFGAVNSDRALMAEASIPEPAQEEITFLEPELDLKDPGNEDGEVVADDAPLPKGEPEPAPEEQPVRTEPGKNPKPQPVVEKHAVQKKPSPVKEADNSLSDADSKRLKSMKGKFNSPNGAPDGHNGQANGQGHANARGSLSGRRFMGCPTSDVKVRQRVTVVVRVKVNADGRVTSAHATSGPSEYYSTCERWARKARWSAKEGAPEASGTITFTITPRQS